jgi:lysophospholipase
MAEAAPLYSVPEAPMPEGAAEWYAGADGTRLRAALFPAQGRARGSVVLSPGRTEPIEKYVEVIGELAARGFVVLCHDWRGQGLSARALKDPLAGHADGWRPFLDDFRRMLAAFEARLPKPWIAMGHSMGGGLTALALAEGETRFSAAVLSAPMLGLNLGNRSLASVRWLSGMMRLFGRGAAFPSPPADPFAETFADNVLTHDAARYARTRAQIVAHPELALGSPTFGWVHFATLLVQRVERSPRIDALPIPVLVVTAGEEKLCDNQASRRFAKRIPKGRYVEIEGAYHEVLMETDPLRAQFWAAFDPLADEVAPRG